MSRVYAATIEAGSTSGLLGPLIMWALPGAVLQLAGGTSRQTGILFATGLLIFNPIAGWTAVFALILRFAILRRYGAMAEGPMYVLAGGFIAGSALSSFASAALRPTMIEKESGVGPLMGRGSTSTRTAPAKVGLGLVRWTSHSL